MANLSKEQKLFLERIRKKQQKFKPIFSLRTNTKFNSNSSRMLQMYSGKRGK